MNPASSPPKSNTNAPPPTSTQTVQNNQKTVGQGGNPTIQHQINNQLNQQSTSPPSTSSGESGQAPTITPSTSTTPIPPNQDNPDTGEGEVPKNENTNNKSNTGDRTWCVSLDSMASSCDIFYVLLYNYSCLVLFYLVTKYLTYWKYCIHMYSLKQLLLAFKLVIFCLFWEYYWFCIYIYYLSVGNNSIPNILWFKCTFSGSHHCDMTIMLTCCILAILKDGYTILVVTCDTRSNNYLFRFDLHVFWRFTYIYKTSLI